MTSTPLPATPADGRSWQRSSATVVRELPDFVGDVAAVIAERALPLVGRHLEVVPALLEDTYGATARAGIDSLRAIPELVTDAINL